MRMLTVSKNEAGQRLDKLLAKYLNLAGKSFIYKMMRKKNITLNEKKCDGSEHLTEGDEIKLFLAEETIEKFSEVKIQKVQKKKLDIVYEDEHILLINKPSRIQQNEYNNPKQYKAVLRDMHCPYSLIIFHRNVSMWINQRKE